MIGELLSIHGSFLFICGIAIGLVFRARRGSPPEPETPEWEHAVWTDDDVWIDGDSAFGPQLLNLHRALRRPCDTGVTQVVAKRATPV